MVIRDIDDQYMKHVFVFEGTCVMYLEFVLIYVKMFKWIKVVETHDLSLSPWYTQKAWITLNWTVAKFRKKHFTNLKIDACI